ncbi:MAG TPA: glutathione S-transferase family protein [Eoetvoesiella sp.]|jgi:glutathione S-transferase|uniref:glutathione S-transferase family protein n=1 Tax=Eoetvoesiella sp. TaxID=1966355 RepID=UPI002D022B2C|nr:glutathione S-transferase family protein [Eoetvoesiella sp.]HWK62173.1 glutathione S-transferase family protein [Eoetvoesiella sp.]
MVELYHFWSSVCSVRVRMALEEKNISWTSRYIDLFKFDQLRPEYLEISPEGVVPVLVHNGHAIHESEIINEYIDAAFPGPRLVPQDPLQAARMREFVKTCNDGFDAIVKLTMVKYILPKLRKRWGDDVLREQAARRPSKYLRDMHSRAVRGEISEAELSESRADIEHLLDRLEATLDPGPWIVDQFSLADISLAPFMFRLAALGQDQFWSSSRRPRVNAWYAAISARPSFNVAVSWPDESGGGYEEVGLTTQSLKT